MSWKVLRNSSPCLRDDAPSCHPPGEGRGITLQSRIDVGWRPSAGVQGTSRQRIGVEKVVLDLVNRADEASGRLRWITPVWPVRRSKVAVDEGEHIPKARKLRFLQHGADSLVATSDEEEHGGIILPHLSQVIASQRVLNPEIDCAPIKAGEHRRGSHLVTISPKPESQPLARGSLSGTRKYRSNDFTESKISGECVATRICDSGLKWRRAFKTVR